MQEVEQRMEQLPRNAHDYMDVGGRAMQEQLPRRTRRYVEHSDRAKAGRGVPLGRRTTAGMQEVEQCRSNCRAEGWCNIRASIVRVRPYPVDRRAKQDVAAEH